MSKGLRVAGRKKRGRVVVKISVQVLILSYFVSSLKYVVFSSSHRRNIKPSFHLYFEKSSHVETELTLA